MEPFRRDSHAPKAGAPQEPFYGFIYRSYTNSADRPKLCATLTRDGRSVQAEAEDARRQTCLYRGTHGAHKSVLAPPQTRGRWFRER